jgi:hypothetical protein
MEEERQLVSYHRYILTPPIRMVGSLSVTEDCTFHQHQPAGAATSQRAAVHPYSPSVLKLPSCQDLAHGFMESHGPNKPTNP